MARSDGWWLPDRPTTLNGNSARYFVLFSTLEAQRLNAFVLYTLGGVSPNRRASAEIAA